MTTWTADFASDTLSVFDTVVGSPVVTGGRLNVPSTSSASPGNVSDNYGEIDVFGASGPVDGICYIRFYFKETTGVIPNTILNGVGMGAIQLVASDATSMGYIYLGHDSNLRIFTWFSQSFESGISVVQMQSAVATNSWVLAEWVFSLNAQSVVGIVNGAWYPSQDEGGNLNSAGKTLRYLRFGSFNHCSAGGGDGYTVDPWYDHLYVSDDITAGWPGPDAESGTALSGGTFYVEGFEHGGAPSTSWGSGLGPQAFGSAAATIETGTSNVRSGKYSLKCAQGALNATSGIIINTGAPQSPEIVIRAAFKFTNFPTVGAGKVPIIRLSQTSSLFSQITVDSTGQLRADVDSTDGLDTLGVNLSTGVWYAIDAFFSWSGTTWFIKWRVRNDVGGLWTACTEESRTGHTTDYLQGKTIRVGWITSPSTTGGKTLYLDDLVFSFHGSDWPVQNGSVQVVRPNANGTHNTSGDFWQSTDNGTTQSAITSAAYQMIDDDPLDTTNLVAQNVVGAEAYLEFQFADTPYPAQGSAAAMTEFYRTQNASSTPVFSFAVANGSGNELRTTGISTPGHTQERIYVNPLILNIGSSSVLPQVWTRSEINDVRVRYGYVRTGISGGNAARMDDALFQVCYDDRILSPYATIDRRIAGSH